MRSNSRCSLCLQFALILGAGPVLHRPTSLVIHRLEWNRHRILFYFSLGDRFVVALSIVFRVEFFEFCRAVVRRTPVRGARLDQLGYVSERLFEPVPDDLRSFRVTSAGSSESDRSRCTTARRGTVRSSPTGTRRGAARLASDSDRLR